MELLTFHHRLIDAAQRVGITKRGCVCVCNRLIGSPNFTRNKIRFNFDCEAETKFSQFSMEYDYRNRAGHPFVYHSPSSSPSSGTGIRVAVKPGYQITLPPQLSTHIGEVHPRSNFQFDFDLERKVLAEAGKGNPDWSHLVSENSPSRPASEALPSTPPVNPIVGKYSASGLNQEAVNLAVANYGDNPTKVQEFVKGYTLLREMGFSSNSVAEALFTYENDSDKALAHFLNNSS